MRVRFAPSPTGDLHIGGARTAIFNWLLARQKGGSFVLRFEDTDQIRNINNAEKKLLNDLAWLGIDWDEGVDVGGDYAPYRQTERIDTYNSFAEQLIKNGNAFYCYCSKDELNEVKQQQISRKETPKYNGNCRHLDEATRLKYISEGRKPIIRFHTPSSQKIVIDDVIRGLVEFDTSDIGDFVIVRADGIPMYNFAVVVDDYLMKITHVIRGEEHLSNTPQQILLYQSLDFEIPKFAHISLILNENKQKMSKRDKDLIQLVEQYRDLGYLPEAVTNFLCLLGWSPDDDNEIFSLDDLIKNFSLDRVAKHPSVFDVKKLNWMSNEYMKKANPQRIVDLVIPQLQKNSLIDDNFLTYTSPIGTSGLDWLVQLIELYQEQMSCASDFIKLAYVFFEKDINIEEELKTILNNEKGNFILNTFFDLIAQLDNWSIDTIQKTIKDVQAVVGVKGKDLFMPIRVALTGQTHGRDLNKTIYLLGKDKVKNRLFKQLTLEKINF